MYEKNYAIALREDLIAAVKNNLTPIAQKYHYSETGLEVTIRWKPIVLILGNYSSGKSTFINELLGQDIQVTGQAPTDDSFTVITGDEKITDLRSVDGQSLLNDERYPFERLRRHGDRFTSHFRGKVIKSDVLKDLAIIDTPGMLDSVSEKDRGYDYQHVIADLAEIADLTLILFDPHKAGTIRETYKSLRETLPATTFENQMVFVLNRIDECTNLNDLLRVYGTLCWNLSQMTGRKDIPTIHLSYSSSTNTKTKPAFLELLGNSREQLRKAVFDAPKYRLANLTSFVETHGDRLTHMLEGYLSYLKGRRKLLVKSVSMGALMTTLISMLVGLSLIEGAFGKPFESRTAYIFSGSSFVVMMVIWIFVFTRLSVNGYRRNTLQRIDYLTKLGTQHREDTWLRVKPLVAELIKNEQQHHSVGTVGRDLKSLVKVRSTVSKDARAALVELENLQITPYI